MEETHIQGESKQEFFQSQFRKMVFVGVVEKDEDAIALKHFLIGLKDQLESW